MVDGDRVYPVEYGFLHHSTGPDFVNAEDLEVQDWYSNTGKDRGYGGGSINPRHEHPSRPGQLSYAMAQYGLREYTKDGNKYGWRVTDLIKLPLSNVTWSVGNWDYNTRSFSVEVCGNYLNKVLPDKALMLLADEIFRPIDQELVAAGYAGGLNVWLHQEVFATACPGRIKENRDKLVDMVNNPDKWNKELFPSTPPTPVITTRNETTETPVAFTTTTKDDNTLPIGERRIETAGQNGVRTVITKITYQDGNEIKRETISDSVTKNPVTEVVLVGTKVEPVPQDPTPHDQEQDVKINGIMDLLRVIGKAFADFLAKFSKKG